MSECRSEWNKYTDEWIDDYIIAIANTEVDSSIIKRFRGSKCETKDVLLALLNEGKGNDPENFEYGTETVEDIEDDGIGLYAYATYNYYHIDYTAIPFCNVDFIK